ncbi:hypothetical protein ASG25_15510 [Rhizobium sp. Leaf384]|uniref:transcription termination/antitermination protein NusG n=1 Tax=unclassified Rhizobium TaxID=2613769 RepID=UPI0007150672|nr:MULTISPECIES: transcription termination/antitermination NusG family protein [unclassified Rhizobium]KQS76827.1 hypothetical protein ASG25_15510 [Rhizobium sp. Leaf384]KQS78097.1 hypothetical protein ASG58_06725 [Rhizobium sp. Leaf383]
MNMQHEKAIFDFTQPISQHPFDDAKLLRGGISEQIAIRDLSLAGRRLVAEEPESAAWYCLKVEPRKEFAVENVLLVADVEALVQCEPAGIVVRRGRQWEKPRTPWMPGYVLVQCVYSAGAIMSLLRLRHVLGVVGGPARPHRVSGQSIRNFNEKVAQLLAQADAVKRASNDRDHAPFMVGETARVTLGPFANFECVILSIGKGKSPRCKALTKVFGNETPFDIPLASLAKL